MNTRPVNVTFWPVATLPVNVQHGAEPQMSIRATIASADVVMCANVGTPLTWDPLLCVTPDSSQSIVPFVAVPMATPVQVSVASSVQPS